MPALKISAFVCLFLFVIGCESATDIESDRDASSDATEDRTPESSTADDQSPQITLRELSPADYQSLIEAHRGQVVLVDFWATWCGPCVEQFPHTVELHKKYGGDGLVVISVSMDDPENQRKDVIDFLTEHDAQMENRICSEGLSQSAFEAFDIEGGALPHYKLYDRQGNLTTTFATGDIDRQFTSEDIQTAVEEALKER